MATQDRNNRYISTGSYRWLSATIGGRSFMRLARIEGEHRPDLVAPFSRNGQIMAGTGALVFEGELLEMPRRP